MKKISRVILENLRECELHFNKITVKENKEIK